MNGMDHSFRHSEGEKQKKSGRPSRIDDGKYSGYTNSVNWERGESSQPSLEQSLRGMLSAEIVDRALESRERVGQDQDIDPLWRDGTMTCTERIVNLTSEYRPEFVGGLAGTPEMGRSFGQYLRRNEYKEFRRYQTLVAKSYGNKTRDKMSIEEKAELDSLKEGKGHMLYNIYMNICQRGDSIDEFITMISRKYHKEYLDIVNDWLKTVSFGSGEQRTNSKETNLTENEPIDPGHQSHSDHYLSFSSGEGSSSQQQEAPSKSYADLPMTELTPRLLARGQRDIYELEERIRKLNR